MKNYCIKDDLSTFSMGDKTLASIAAEGQERPIKSDHHYHPVFMLILSVNPTFLSVPSKLTLLPGTGQYQRMDDLDFFFEDDLVSISSLGDKILASIVTEDEQRSTRSDSVVEVLDHAHANATEEFFEDDWSIFSGAIPLPISKTKSHLDQKLPSIEATIYKLRSTML